MSPYRTPAPVPVEPPKSRLAEALDYLAWLNTEKVWARKHLGGHWERTIPWAECYSYGKWARVTNCNSIYVYYSGSPQGKSSHTGKYESVECEDHGAPR
jgi:hypothetical protein